MQPLVGFNMSTDGNRQGWGDHVRTLDAAGKRAVCMSVGGEGFGDIKALWDSGSQVNHVVAIRYMPPDGTQDVPLYHVSPQEAVGHWLNWYAPRIGNDVKQYHQRVITKHGNELNKNEIEWLSEFYTLLHPALLSVMGWQSHRICCFSFASGEPEKAQWEQPQTLQFLRLAGDNPDKFVIGLHEYSYANDLQSGYPHNIGRFLDLFDVCDRHRIKRPKIVMHEFGWRQEWVPDPATAMAQMDQLSGPLYTAHDIPVGIWTLKSWHTGCIPDCVQKLIAPTTEFVLTKDYPVAPPPPGTHKAIIVLASQEGTAAEWERLANYSYTFRHTMTASADDARNAVLAGNPDSFVKVHQPTRPSQVAAISMFDQANIQWVELVV